MPDNIEDKHLEDDLLESPDVSSGMADTTIEGNIIAAENKETGDRLTESGLLGGDMISEIKKMVTAEVMAELKENNALAEKEKEIAREQADIDHQKYVDTMMKSDDPWVSFIGEVRDTEKGQRLEMEWNTAFVEFLREIGLTGADEEQLVQKYITALLYDMEERNNEEKDDTGGEYA